MSLSPSPPEPLAFHAVAAGTTAADTLTITNTGAAPLSVHLEMVDDGSGGSGTPIFAFAQEPPADTLLAAGASYAVAVRFTPSEARSYSGALRLTHNAPGLNPVTITLQGSGLDGPALWLAPGALAFGPVVVGEVKADSVRITNSGTGTLTGSYALPAGSAFRFEDGTWGPVAFSLDASVSDTVSVVVFFEASDVVNYTGVLTFSDAGGVQVLGAVSLSGLGTLPASSTGRFYYLRDHLGSVRATLNEEGSVVHYDDDYPFGAPMPLRSHVEGDEGAPEGKPRYTGHEREEDIDPDAKAVYYAGARYYDALIGRWSVVDPLADDYPSHSPYNYALNSPLLLIDSDGEAPEFCCPIGHGGGVWNAAKAKAGGNSSKALDYARQDVRALGAGSKTVLEASVGLVSEPADLLMAGYDALKNGPSWQHLLVLGPLSFGMLRAGGNIGDAAGDAARAADGAGDASEVMSGITSLVKEDDRLLKLARQTFKSNTRLRDDANRLIQQLNEGNLNPGIGTKQVVGNIYEARSRSGARVYFRQNGDTVEIVGYSNKHNQDQVINRIKEVYDE